MTIPPPNVPPTNTPPNAPVDPPCRTAVIGAGQMGLVAAAILCDAPPEHEVVICARDEREAAGLVQTGQSPKLPGFTLPKSVRVTASGPEALEGCGLVLSALPSQAARQVWTALAPHLPERAGIVTATKGIETGTLQRPTQVIASTLRDDPDARPRPLAVLSGPSIAAELARRKPASVIAASDDAEFAEEVQRRFSTGYLRVYTNPDVLGVELAGAVKNIIAIAAGIADGLVAGDNAKSALLARGVAEISRLGVAMGGLQETFAGLAGVGDLVTTCFSAEGRNRACGEALGRGATLAEHLEQAQCVVEGVETTRAALELADKYRVDMPITRAVGAVLFEGLDPAMAINRLMSRELKPERLGE